MNGSKSWSKSLQLWLLCAALVVWAGAAAEEGPAPPNFVFVIADDLRFDALGVTAHPHAKTPHIDRLAAEGALFTRFFVTTPLCSPSRASFLTGLYPHSHRIINNDKQGLDVTSHRLMTFPRILREEARYVTAFIGKWHMGFDDSRRPGFDHWISFKGQGEFIDPVANINGRRTQTTGYATDLLNRWAVDFVETAPERPFCLFFAHKAVHSPYLPAPRHDSLFADVEYAPPAAAADDLEGKPVMRRRLEGKEPRWRYVIDSNPERGEPRRGRPLDRSSVIRDRLRCLVSIDEGIGALYQALSRAGKLERTFFAFTSDNGFLLGEHGEFHQKRWAYDECLRVPFVVRYPPLVAAGSRIDAPVLNVDVAPTILELASVKWAETLEGRSLLPLFTGSQAPWRKTLLFEHFREEVVPQVPDWQAVRTSRWKYVRYPDLEGMDELYDLENDPRELKNLLGADELPSAAHELRAELARLLATPGVK